MNLAKQKKEIPITDPLMTRFNISLEEGVEMVMWAIEHALGGEIFVPKIPSYIVKDLAEAIAPSLKTNIIGLRPGEKMHEEMITESDAFNTIELSKYYAILPSFTEKDKYLKYFSAREVPPGFKYNSGTNTDFLDIDRLRYLITKFIDPNFKPV